MSCPNCKSHDTRISEQGIFCDTYFCNNCSRPFERISGISKSVGLGVVVTVLTGGNILLGIAATMIGNNSDSS